MINMRILKKMRMFCLYNTWFLIFFYLFAVSFL